MMQGDAPRGRAFWILLVLGWGVIVFGLIGTFDNAGRTRPANFALWFVGSALAHDALLAPAVIVVGLMIAKLVPAKVRAVVHAGLIVAGTVTVVALPLVLGRGGQPGNTSALPRNYLAGLLAILAATAMLTASAAWRQVHQRQVHQPGGK